MHENAETSTATTPPTSDNPTASLPVEVTQYVAPDWMIRACLPLLVVAGQAVVQPIAHRAYTISILAMPLLASAVVYIAWAYRIRTRVTPSGLELRTLNRTRHIHWHHISGVRTRPGRFARLMLTDGTETTLPGVTTRLLPWLVVVTEHRVTAADRRA
ncbi:PH domain-containing protein [Nocardia wallacei]|uniref:PH domain-containing protein n=1 Tax=Nocardia wallacei TaxID=480035 RepID=UPI002455EBCC|nr:PH domain-containing protein [Nocardia wallacei]